MLEDAQKEILRCHWKNIFDKINNKEYLMIWCFMKKVSRPYKYLRDLKFVKEIYEIDISKLLIIVPLNGGVMEDLIFHLYSLYF